MSATDLSSLLLDSTSCSSANNDRSHPVCEADSTIRNTMLPFPSILLSRECPALVCIFLHSSRTSYGTACCRRRVCSAPSTVAAAAVAVKITGRCATARHASREARSHVDEWTCLTRTHESCGNRFIYTVPVTCTVFYQLRDTQKNLHVHEMTKGQQSMLASTARALACRGILHLKLV